MVYIIIPDGSIKLTFPMVSHNAVALNRLKMHLQAKPRRESKITSAGDGPSSVLVGLGGNFICRIANILLISF